MDAVKMNKGKAEGVGCLKVGEKKMCVCCHKVFELDFSEIGGFYTGALCPECHNELVKNGKLKECMKDTVKIREIKAQARLCKNMQYPLLEGLSRTEKQKLMDESCYGDYEVVISQGVRGLRYKG